MRLRYQHAALKWSNAFFLAPLILATMFGLYWYVVILAAVFIVSFDFHFFNEAREVYYLDVIFSSTLMASNFLLLFMGYWILPFSIIAIALALTALVFYFQKSEKNYYLYHSLWHIFSAAVCTFCLITYLVSI